MRGTDAFEPGEGAQIGRAREDIEYVDVHGTIGRQLAIGDDERRLTDSIPAELFHHRKSAEARQVGHDEDGLPGARIGNACAAGTRQTVRPQA